MKYKGTYFNGKSASPKLVEVEVKSNGLLIHSANPESDLQNELLWEHNLINNTDVSGTIVTLKYGRKFPFETLEMDSEYILDEVKDKYPEAPYLKNYFRKFSKTGEKGILIALSLIITFCVTCYFYIIPAAMVFVASVFPKSVEVELGNQIYESLVKEEKIDSLGTVLINRFNQNLKVDTDYDIHVTVVTSEIRNAFALPGGNIVVYTGILKDMKSYEELVALLGHETGHIHYRHSLKMLFKNLSNYIIISAIFQDINGILAVIVDHSASLEQLSYNRQIESESDEYGYNILKANKINPEGMVSLFEQLNVKGDNGIPAFLSTHPQLEERISETRKKINDDPYIHHSNDSLKIYFDKIKAETGK